MFDGVFTLNQASHNITSKANVLHMHNLSKLKFYI